MVKQRERPLGGVVETCPLLLVDRTIFPCHSSFTFTGNMMTSSANLVGHMDVGSVVKQVPNHSQVATATRCNEGRVPGAFFLHVEAVWVVVQDVKQPIDVSVVR